MRLWHCHFVYISNAQIIQVFNFVDKIKLFNAATSDFINNQFLFNLKTDVKKRSKPNVNKYIIPTLLNKIIRSIEDFYNMYIKNKYVKIVKHKTMTPKV